MSAIRLNQPTKPQSAGLRAVTGGKLATLLGKSQSKSRMVIVLTIAVGIGAIQILQLLLNVAVGSSTYALAGLKAEKKQLVLQQQILAEQVDSLASNQNLANTAQKMGMISNANPVFLRLSDQRVFGKPKAALNADNRLSRNLIPSSVMTVTSNLTEATANTATAEASSLLPSTGLTLIPVVPAKAAAATKAAAPVASAPLTFVPSGKSASTTSAPASSSLGSLPAPINH